MTAPQNHPHLTPDTGQANQGKDANPTPDRPTAPRSRIGGLWVACVVFALVLLLLLIFVLENGQRVEVSFFGTHGRLPLGVALLLAAVFGVLLVALPGTARIVQLRILRHRRGPHAGAPPAAGPIPPSPDEMAGQQTNPQRPGRPSDRGM
jgi:uncharacterized integral membrane protein